MTKPHARAKAPPMPPGVAGVHAKSVAQIADIIAVEAQRMAERQAQGALSSADTRKLTDLAQASRALATGTLWGARAVLAKSGGDK